LLHCTILLMPKQVRAETKDLFGDLRLVLQPWAAMIDF